MFSISRFLKLSSFVLAGFLTANAQAQSNAPDLSKVTLRVAYYKGLHKALFEAAKLDNTPYKIDWKEFNTGGQHIEAIRAGSIDLGSGSEITGSFAAQENASAVKVVATYKEDLNNQGLFVAKDSPIKTIADLKGKRVAYTRGTTSHYYLYKMLKEAGLSFNDIVEKPLAPSDGLSAFAKGEVDAWAVWGFNGQIARQQFGARTLKTAVGYLSGNFQIFASPAAFNDPAKSAAIADFLLRLQQAYAWSNKNYAEYAKVQSKETRVKEADILELFNSRSQNYSLIATSNEAIKTQQQVADAFFELGLLTKKVDVKPLWDHRFDAILKDGEAKLKASGQW